MARRISKLQLFTASLVVMSATILCLRTPKTHASTITVNSPTNGQQFTGNDFNVSGVADADSTVVIIRNSLTIAQTRSDNSGNWSVHLTGLPDGNNTITARSIKNTGYGYFIEGVAPDGKIHQLRLSDNALDVNSPFPIAGDADHHRILLNASPVANIFYATAPGGIPGKPQKFDAVNPTLPVTVTGTYGDTKEVNMGSFSADGTKFYGINANSSIISEVDVATNAWVKDIDTGTPNLTAWRAPNGKIYINSGNFHFTGTSRISILDTSTDTIVKTITPNCPDSATNGFSTTFSQDAAYPYYFIYCASTTEDTGNKILKYDIATDTEVSRFTVDFRGTTGVLNADNSKLYVSSSASIAPNNFSDKTFVFDAATGTLLKTLNMHAGVLAIFQSPDLQHLYAGTPGNDFDQTGFDVIDMNTDEVTHITTSGFVGAVSASSSAVTTANINVSVVLGVKTTAGALANTGAIAISATLLSGLILGSTAFIYYDYRRHKRPLIQADPNANYTLAHHIKVVTIPLLKYRLSVQVARSPSDISGIHRF